MMGKLLQAMSGDLLVSLYDLEYLVKSAPYRYKVYKIDKRKPGEKREIAQPAREVKRLQYWVMENVLKHCPVHSAALAYRKGKSILHNAQAHAKKRYLLKLDFKDFFHSIKAADFRHFVEDGKALHLDGSDVDHLVRILFWMRERGGELILSIGAPSSPALSNILLFEFDRRVAEYCKPLRVSYTRYADDLTFSTNRRDILAVVEGEVSRICKELPYPVLSLNRDKRVHASKAASRRVTGLVLSNAGSVSLGHERKRQLHAAVHHFKLGTLNPQEISSLAGMLAFVHSVEPQFLHALARRYGKAVVDEILRSNRPT